MNTSPTARPTAAGALLPLVTSAFLLLLGYTAPAAENRRTSLLFTGVLIAFLLLACLWSRRSGAGFTSFLCSVTVLLGVGSAYQSYFKGYTKQALLLLMALAAGVAVYLVWRRLGGLSPLLFTLTAASVVVLLVLNAAAGRTVNGATLWLKVGSFSLQPGELLKFLLILLGACSHRNLKRSLIYCVLSLASCGLMLLLHDLGCAVVLFAMFVLMTYILFDDRRLSLGIIAGALVLFILALNINPHAARRIATWTHAMEMESGEQQQKYIKAVLYGGFTGLGPERASVMTGITAAQNDAALAGVMAVLGVPMAAVTLGAYAHLVLLPGRNRSVTPACYLILIQTSMYLFVQVMLNFCGALDTLPFTGIVAPLISSGGSAAVTAGAILGLAAAALHPAVSPIE